MKTLVRTTFAVLVVTLIASHASFATIGPSTRVPEIDPAMGLGALALLSGAIMVIRGRVKA